MHVVKTQYGSVFICEFFCGMMSRDIEFMMNHENHFHKGMKLLEIEETD
jgi:hypothetical protein